MPSRPLRICAVSDLHGHLPVLPEADVLLIAGDVCPDNQFTLCNPERCAAEQAHWLHKLFTPWLMQQPILGPTVMIWGNHDFIGERPRAFWPDLPAFILHDSSMVVEGLIIYGTPWVPPTGRPWALQTTADERQLHTALDDVSRVDILLTHSPAHGLLDVCPAGHVGSRAIRDAVSRLQPRLHVFGHIHEARGEAGTRHNVSYVDGHYRPYRLPIPLITLTTAPAPAWEMQPPTGDE